MFPFSLFFQFFIVLSCIIAVGTNLSQFICIGRFTAVSFQVLGHMKTILVLTLGFFFFGKEGLNFHVALGMTIAVIGMIWYGIASSKPGGKERQVYIPISEKTQKHGILSSQSELDQKVWGLRLEIQGCWANSSGAIEHQVAAIRFILLIHTLFRCFRFVAIAKGEYLSEMKLTLLFWRMSQRPNIVVR